VSLSELCRIGECHVDWVVELVEEGILEPVGTDRSAWRFQSSSLAIVGRVRRLQDDLRLNLAGAAMVLSLVEENAQLKRRLRQLEQETDFPIWMSGSER
jgi:chaperone modulatory protein CbpM